MTCLIAFAVVLDLLGCDPTGPAVPERNLFIEAYFVPGLPLSVRVGKTLSAEEFRSYSCGGIQGECPGPFIVSGAAVTVHSGTSTLPLLEDTLLLSRAVPQGTYRVRLPDTLSIHHNSSYRIEVKALGKTVTGSVSTLSRISSQIVAPVGSIIYGGQPVTLQILKDSATAGVLVVARIDFGQPFNPDFRGKNTLLSVQDNLVSLPWSMFYNTGRNRVYLYGFERSYLNYLQTRTTGNPTVSLFEPLYSVSGGLGMVVAASIDSIDFDIER